jgi:tetratricopeptide (TPR) repeat protein
MNKTMNEAMNLHRAGEITEAEKMYKDILKKYPNNPDVLYLLGILCYQCNNFISAIQYIKEALDFNDSNPYMNFDLGNILRAKGLLDEAVIYYKKAIERDKNIKDAYKYLGEILYSIGQQAEAFQYFQKYIYLSSKLLRIFINKNKDTAIFLNLKCAYSTFKFYASKNHVFRYNRGDCNRFYKIALVRCPYKRIESFYKDKLIKQVTKTNRLPAQLDYLSYFFPRKKLIDQEVSLEELICAIDRGYMDDHLIPQHENIPDNVDEIVHLEKKEEHQIIKQRFDIEFEKTHSTEDIQIELVWTDRMKGIIQKFYQKDFQLFGYEM